MIDIIIPVNEEDKEILKTLFSISIQTIKEKIKVYIIINKLDEKYENIKKTFENKLDITIIYLLKKCKLGELRNKGIKNSKNQYILFLNSGDRICHGYSLEILLNSIEDNDIAYGIEVLEKNDEIIMYDNSINNCLNSKLYKREFIKKNNIFFNDIDKYNEMSFDILTFKLTEKIIYIDEYIVLKKETIKKEIDYEFYNLKNYIENIEWLIKEYQKRNLPDKVIALEINSLILYSYFKYLKYIQYKDIGKIFKWLKNIIDCYSKYKSLVSAQEIENEYLYYYNQQDCIIPDLTLKDFIEKIYIWL